jgi:hypothetical protein
VKTVMSLDYQHKAKSCSGKRRWLIILAAALGAFAGGLAVLLGTRAIPKMMNKMMAGMMQNMMTRMKEGGCAPPDF